MHPASLETRQTQSQQTTVVTTPSGQRKVLLLYALMLGSVMAVVTAPLSALVAHLWLAIRRPTDAVLVSHLRFQLATFWYGVLAGAIGLGLWGLIGHIDLPGLTGWAYGYLGFTLALIWMVGRCALGIRQLLHHLPVPRPLSPLLGGCRVRFTDADR
ncbi:hypothetical protein [Halomonas sp. RT37]|uniref:DUF4870 domain-containing protein n=1 Tax=Halomonas sp. RT37 TaxID=2950872 RepID=A0AAU7KI29_9GAMM